MTPVATSIKKTQSRQAFKAVGAVSPKKTPNHEKMTSKEKITKRDLQAAYAHRLRMVNNLSIRRQEPATSKGLKATQEFWDMHPCDGDFESEDLRLRYRYLKDFFIPSIIERHVPKGGIVLEIGCGQGADLLLLARNADWVTGVDLSEESVRRAQEFLSRKGVSNATAGVANAQDLPFEDTCFDAVYSFGVMHHAPDTQACIDEAFRVLKPNGTAVIMLYRLWSPQFLIGKCVRLVTYPLRRPLAALFSHPMFKESSLVKKLFGTAHAEMVGVPFFRAYSYRKLRIMFEKFKDIKVERYNTGFARLNLVTPNSPRLQSLWKRLEDATANRLGFFNVIVARK